jgi:hypothetical protein
MPPHSNEESCNSYGSLFGSWLPNKDLVLCASANNVATTPSASNNKNFNNNEKESNYEKALEKAFTKLHEDQTLRKFKKTRNKPKYNVKFFPEVEIYTIPNISDLTRKEISTLYLSREEMTNIHREAWKMVDLMNLGIEYEDVDGDDEEEQMGFSKRGLVDLKDAAVERRRRMRENAYKVVFGVQAFHNRRQPIECMDGDAVMADLYNKASTPARDEAYRVARADAADAGYYYRSPQLDSR